ncbi:hypothetical protein [Tautonia rosea]|uniref:hypothetical protein n=1 Tax=Tautonia rosea TaxID=2728037 RepID=UPI0014744A6C|nr:hypothetical protein [Tautonia rosea]
MATPPQDSRINKPDDSLHELTFGGGRVSSSERSPTSFAPRSPDADLTELQHRCRAKAEAARRAALRRRQADSLTDSPRNDPPSDSEFEAWEDRHIDCSYWSDAASDSVLQGITLLEELAGCYEVLSASCALVQEAGEHRGCLEEASPFLVEAQSALREAMTRLQRPEDSDQIAIFELLRMLAARHRVFLKH